MKVLSLFAGSGGIDLGLERAGMQIVAHSEIDPYACKVLAKHWPDVPNLGDISQVDFIRDTGTGKSWALWNDTQRADVSSDIICGGFPCQDVSRAGRRAGVNGGAKSGLWAEYLRAIRDLRPRYVIVENTATLATRGLDRVLGDLAACGYDAEWECIPAAAVGAPHIRDRIFVVAYASGGRHGAPEEAVFAGRSSPELHAWWACEPGVQRVDDGLPNRVERRRALGNAVVPQVAQYIGELVVAHHAKHAQSGAA